MPSVVVVEGDVDQAIVSAIEPSLNVPLPKRPLGREAAIRRAAIAAKQVGTHRIVLLLDRNSYTPDQVQGQVQAVFKSQWGRTTARQGHWYVRESAAVRIVLAGLPKDPLLRSLSVARFTSDDYLLKLLLTDESLHQFCARESNLADVPEDASTLREMLSDLAESLKRRNIIIDSSKRYIHLIRAILGFEGARATLAEYLIKRSPQRFREQVLGPLRDELINDPPL